MDEMRLSVGTRIRDLRIARGMSLSELARESRVAKATLSTIESGEANPTLDTLCSLANALRIPVGHLFGETPRDVTVIRAAEMQALKTQELSGHLAVSLDVEASRLELYAATVAGGSAYQSSGHQRGVTEHLLLNSGRMRFGPKGKEVVLDAGDYARIDASQPHIYEGLSDDVLFTLVMQYPRESIG